MAPQEALKAVFTLVLGLMAFQNMSFCGCSGGRITDTVLVVEGRWPEKQNKRTYYVLSISLSYLNSAVKVNNFSS